MFRVIREQYASRLVDAEVLTFDGDQVVFWQDGAEIERCEVGEVAAIEPVRGNTKARMRAVREVYPNSHTPWSPEADDQLRAEYPAGMSVEQLSQDRGRSPRSIRSRLRKLGIEVPEDPAESGYSDEETRPR
ncbi:MAG: hypothetical protein ACRC35_07885 [Angustibacter sp.]